MKTNLFFLTLSLFLGTLNSNAQLINWSHETELPLGSSLIDGQEISNFGGTGITVEINVNSVGGYPKINSSNGQLIDTGNDNSSFTLSTTEDKFLNIILENSTDLEMGEIITLSNTNFQTIKIQETGSNGGARMTVDSISMSGELPSVIEVDHFAIIQEQSYGEGTKWNATMNEISSFSWTNNTTNGTNNEGFSLKLISSTLGIEMINFDIEKDENDFVQIHWQTASEFNVDHFTVERSIDGMNWEKLSILTGTGNSSTTSNYLIIDDHPYSDVSYYRLEETDFNGANLYSEIKSISIDYQNINHISVYPNPANEEITIEGDKHELTQVSIYNSNGENVTQLTTEMKFSKNKTTMNLSNLNEGVYFVVTESKIQKIVKL